MGDYGKFAIQYARYLIENKNTPSSEGWEAYALKNGFTQSGAKKGCPKDTFLSLCEEGLVNGISPGNYTYSERNRHYALEGVRILNNNPALQDDPINLWRSITDVPETYNQQMHIVCALWKAKLINREQIQTNTEN